MPGGFRMPSGYLPPAVSISSSTKTKSIKAGTHINFKKGTHASAGSRDFGKDKPPVTTKPMNVDYGDTMQPPEMTQMMPGGFK